MTETQRAAMQAALNELTVKAYSPTAAIDRATDILRAALAERGAEPIAWGMRHSDGRIYDCIAPGEHDREPGVYTVPLYAHPPRREWQSLTDEEIVEVADGELDIWSFARAVEAALKEKNGA